MLICMCGAAATGKSSVAKQYAKWHNAVVVSTDTIREELFGSAAVQKLGDLVFKIAYQRIEEALYYHRNVIFDAMNLKVRDRKKFLKKFKSLHNGYNIVLVMETSLEEAKRRNRNRSRVVPDEVIEKQFQKFVRPTESEGWDIVKFI